VVRDVIVASPEKTLWVQFSIGYVEVAADDEKRGCRHISDEQL